MSDENTRAITGFNTPSKVSRHRPAVMGDQHPPGICSESEDHVIVEAGQARVVRGHELDGRFSPPDTGDDRVMEIGVGLEPDPHVRA